MKIKTIQLTPVIGKHDLEVKLKNARKLLEKGNKIKLSLRFKGRQMAHQDLGLNKIEEVINSLSDICVTEAKLKLYGYEISAMLTPTRSILDRIKRENSESRNNSNKRNRRQAELSRS